MFDRIGIRARISGGSLIIAILISLAAGIVINARIERIVRDGTIAVLDSDAIPYVIALRDEPGDSFDDPGPSQLLAVLAPDASTPVDTLPADLAVPLSTLRTADGQVIETGEQQYLLRVIPVTVSGDTWTVIAARSTELEASILSQMRFLLISGLSLIASGVAVTAWILTSVSLGPVKRLRTTAEMLTDTTRSELLPVGKTGDEISRLARTLNDLITRLRDSASRERQLVSDASHELRTPLAILRTQLELARTGPSSIPQLIDDIQGAEKSATRLSNLLASLLELSSIEAATGTQLATAAELENEADAAIDRAQFRNDHPDVRIDYRRQAPTSGLSPIFEMAPQDYGRILDNLLTNSLRALESTGTVEVGVEITRTQLRTVVTDTGGGLPDGFESRALDRFSRGDHSRVRGGGAGLGLAIVAAIVRNAHGTIALDNSIGAGLTVTIVIPAAPDDLTRDLDSHAIDHPVRTREE